MIIISLSSSTGNDGKESIVVMTCAGELLEGGDATHRLIVTASVR